MPYNFVPACTSNNVAESTMMYTHRKCPQDDRLFRYEGQTIDSCTAICEDNHYTLGCNFFGFTDTGEYAGVCIGCNHSRVVNHTMFDFYMVHMPCKSPPMLPPPSPTPWLQQPPSPPRCRRALPTPESVHA